MQETCADLVFSNGNDEFSRKPIAEKVIRLLCSDIDISPMVIDGGWGAGKTIFCHKLINLMKETEEDKYHLLYIDAFRADHADEPLLTVLAAVINLIPTEDKPAFIQKVIPAARFTVKTILKAGVGHLLRKDTDSVIEDFDSEVQKVADKAIDASVESLLKEHSEAEKSLESLQSVLKDLAQEKPIVIFVDELDRCRPDFAVNMLEIIKHIFDVEGVKFVLVTNTEQLKAAVKHRYGPTVDAQKYLDKFIKFSFRLSHLANQGSYSRTHASIKHYENIIRNYELFNGSRLLDYMSLELASRIIEWNEMSLREVETIVRHLAIYQTLSDRQAFGGVAAYNLLRLTGAFLRCVNPDLAKSICMNKADANSLGDFLGVSKLPSFKAISGRPHAADIVMAMLGPECQQNRHSFLPSEGEDDKWEELISNCFNYSYSDFPKGERIQLVKDTIMAMNLSGH